MSGSFNDTEIFNLIEKELKRQKENIELIASENIVSEEILAADGSCLTNKYAEGYPGKRYYGGCEVVDEIESIAIGRAKELFNAGFANVQAHSGSQANFAVLLALLKPGDTILGLDLAAGGHLTHGLKASVSGKWFNAISYGVNADGFIDYDSVEKLAKEHKPKLIISGASAYARFWDFKKIGEIAKSVGAWHMSDIAHYAGLIAAGLYPSPIEYADVVTSTTHKTLRGPRGGLVLTNDETIAKKINSAIFPGEQGGPLMHIVAAKAVCFGEALKPEFKVYQNQVLKNAKELARTLKENGLKIVTDGTDSHMFLVDLRPVNVTGNIAQEVLEKANITLNKNSIPFDVQKSSITSGIRIGSPAVTTRNMKGTEMVEIANAISRVLKNINDPKVVGEVKEQMKALCKRFPIYKNLGNGHESLA
ncbi:MAG: serine hydroxymethyltransferase [Elusimicrobiota bacterium]|jgi:glycine hydroxymethyltransferase|nr:serine hydroxymethyltransferase [Elusimicrobiota bacterium]